jgi:hypothetical protein
MVSFKLSTNPGTEHKSQYSLTGAGQRGMGEIKGGGGGRKRKG